MSEPQRKSFDEVTEGQEPGAGIADAATVAGGTISADDPAAHASQDQVGPGGFPHEPAPSVPATPTDAGEEEPAERQDGSRGPGPA